MRYKTYCFGDLVEKWIDNRGKTPPLSENGIPLLEVKHLPESNLYPKIVGTKFVDKETYDSWFRAYLEPNDILFSTVGTTARVVMTPPTETVAIAQNILGIRFKKDLVDPWFMFYYMRGKQFQHDIEARLVTTVQASIKRADMVGIPIAVPQLDAQKELVHRVISLDHKIQLNQDINQTLKQMAQALFKSWFIDFEPVKAKISVLEAGGSQEEATLAAMTAISGKDAGSLAVFEQVYPEKYDELRAIAELFPLAMQDSELGEIPVGWFCTDLSYLALLNNSSWSKKNAPESLKYVDLANTKWGIIHSTEDFLFSDAPSRARRILKPGDTIVGTVRPGNGSYAFIAEEGLTGSTGFAVLTPKHAHFSSFIYICATSKDNIERLAHLADGGAYPAVNAEVILSTPCIIPIDHGSSKNLIECFHYYVRELFAFKHNNLRQNKSLEQLRDTLLPKLLSGEITLPDAEKIAKEADYV